jgi:hypothetical protein
MKARFFAAIMIASFNMSLAHADIIYDWTVSSDNQGSSFNSSGTFTLSNSTITAWSGTWDGVIISGILPSGSFAGNDNAYPINGNGVSFGLASALIFGSDTINLYDSGTGLLWNGQYQDRSINATIFTATAESTAAPEPSSIALVGAGLLGLMGVARRRRA